MHDLQLTHSEETTDSRTGTAHYFVRNTGTRTNSFKVVERATGVNGKHEGRYFVQTWAGDGWSSVISDVTGGSPMAAAILALEVLGLIRQADAHESEALDVRVAIHRSGGSDNAVVVQIDTDFAPDASDGGPGLRVNVNDGDAFTGVPYGPVDDGLEDDLRMIRKFDSN